MAGRKMIKGLYIWKLVNGQTNCNYSELVVSSKGHAAKDLSCASKDPEQFCRQERLTVNHTSNCKISKNPLPLTFCPREAAFFSIFGKDCTLSVKKKITLLLRIFSLSTSGPTNNVSYVNALNCVSIHK